MSAKLIFPGFPQKKIDDQKSDDEFKPEISMNRFRNDVSSKENKSNSRKNSNLSDEENETLNKIVLDRPIIKNKKKQKIKKITLEESLANNNINDDYLQNKGEKIDRIEQSNISLEKKIIFQDVTDTEKNENDNENSIGDYNNFHEKTNNNLLFEQKPGKFLY